jgi:hypothetical protein
MYFQNRNIGKRNNLKLWEQYIKESKHDSQNWLWSPMSEGGEP